MKSNYVEIIEKYERDIEITVRAFIKKSTMPFHLFEDMLQEALLLIYTRLDTYNPELSGVRTYTLQSTRIACLRYRHDYFKLTTAPDYIMEAEDSGESDDIYTILENMGIRGKDRDIIADRVEGYTLLEISAKHDISVNRIYELMDEVGEILNSLE